VEKKAFTWVDPKFGRFSFFESRLASVHPSCAIAQINKGFNARD
jgi:hypothetical protein